MFKKLQNLRDEDESDDRMRFLKKLQDDNGQEEDNFFLEDDVDLTKDNGFHQIDMCADG